MADVEPSNGELAWRLAEIKEIVQDIPGRREYTEYQLRVESRFMAQADDIAELRKTHTEDLKAVLERMDRHEADHKAAQHRRGADWRQLLYSGVAPFAIGVFLLVVTTWVSKGK